MVPGGIRHGNRWTLKIRPCCASPSQQGPDLPVTDRRLEAYRELADTGIMEPDGEDFRFTEEGWARREELIAPPRPIFAGLSHASRSESSFQERPG